MGRRFLKIFLILFIIFLGIGYLIIEYPICYIDTIVENSKKYDVDPVLVSAIINVESHYNERAISHKEAKGLMQIADKTGLWASEEIGLGGYTSESLYDPEININIGTWYINRLTKEFDGEEDLVLAAYNAGSGNVSKWLKDEKYSKDGEKLDNIPFKETEEYLKKIEKNYKVYEKLYNIYFKLFTYKDYSYISYFHEIRRKVNKL